MELQQELMEPPRTDPTHVLHLLLICRKTLVSQAFPKSQKAGSRIYN